MFYFLSKGYDVLVNVTNLCDARCVMCNIWKNQDFGNSYISPQLLESLHPLSTVSFAGGEPFLHDQIVDIVRVVHDRNPSAKIVFSTNGFRTDEIVAKAADVLKIHKNTQVTISLDGVGIVHDRIRGVPGAWDKVNTTFDRLREIGMPAGNFAFTITADNFAALPEVYAHAKSKGAGISLAVAQSSKFLNVEIPTIDHDKVYPHLKPIIEEHLRSSSPHDWARAFFFYGMLRYLKTGKRPLPCDALDNQLMIDQTGAVFSCHPLLLLAGNLSEQPLDKILKGEKATSLRPEIHACDACWEVCTARSSIRKHLASVALWVLANKPLAHVGRWRGDQPSLLFPQTKA